METSPEGVIGYSFMMEKIAEFRPGVNNKYEVEAFPPDKRTKEQYNSTLKPEDGVIHHKYDTLEGVQKDGWPQEALYDVYVNQTPDMYKANPKIGDEDMYSDLKNQNRQNSNSYDPNSNNMVPFPKICHQMLWLQYLIIYLEEVECFLKRKINKYYFNYKNL